MTFPHDQLQQKSFQKLSLKLFIKTSAKTLAVIKTFNKSYCENKHAFYKINKQIAFLEPGDL